MSSEHLVSAGLVSEEGHSARLAGVVICSADLDHDIGVFSAISGATSQLMAHRNPGSPDAAVFVVGDARLSIAGSTDGENAVRRGIERLVIEVNDLEVTAHELARAGAKIERFEDALLISRQWAGVLVEVRGQRTEDDKAFGAADVVLDHVAILVDDVPGMADRWAVITGGPPAHSGVHPLGTSIAAVSAVGARLVDQPPHIIVHPSDASGVPVQLTPRVHH